MAFRHGITVIEIPSGAVGGGSPGTPPAEVALLALTLSAAILAEGAARGAAVGSLQGISSGSTLLLTANAGGRFQLAGTVIQAGPTATDYETGALHQVTVRETHPDAPAPGYRETTLTIAIGNVAEQPPLGALLLSATSLTPGQAAAVNITGATAGSTILLASGALPAGMALNSAARIITGTPTAPGKADFELGEVLADSPNTGRKTAASLNVTAAADTTRPTITSANPSGARPEGQAIGGALTASEPVTWSVTGPDAARVTLNPATGVWSLEPTSYATKSSYEWSFVATDAAGNASLAPQAVSITITDVVESLFLQDTFTAPSNTDITNVVPELGGAWLLHPTNTPATPLRIDDGGRVYSPVSALYYNAAVPPTKNYRVQAEFYRRGALSGDRMSFAGRCSATEARMYLVRYDQATASVTLSTLIGTTLAPLGSYPVAIEVGASIFPVLVMNESQISVELDGATVSGPVTNNDIADAGFVALRGGNSQGATTGIHVGMIEAAATGGSTGGGGEEDEDDGPGGVGDGSTPVPATIYGAGVQRMAYEPEPVAQPATLAALVTQLGVTSADVVDFATGNAGGPFASINAWLTACYNGGAPKIGALPSGTYSHASAMQKAPRALYGYGVTMPEIVESLTHSTTGSVNWGNDGRVVLTRDIYDFECRHIKWTGFHTVLGSGRYSQPLVDPDVKSDTYNQLRTSPYAPSSVYKHTRLVDPRVHGAAMQTRRVGRVKFGGGTGTVSAMTALRVKPGGFAHSSNDSAWNYFNDTVWAANTETVPVAASSGATVVGPAAAASALITRINADSATTNTRAIPGKAVGEVYIIRDLLAVTSTSGPEDYLHLYCTTTGTLTIETDTSFPAARFVDCKFTNVDTVVVSSSDVVAPGLTEPYRCELVGTWGFLENQHTRWDGSGVRASNNIWRDCVGTRQQPASGVQGTGTFLYLASEKTGFNRLHALYPTIFNVDRNTATDIESIATDSSANASAAVFVDVRYPSPLSAGTITYNKVHRVKNLEGNEDSNAVYGKSLGGGIEVAYNWLKDCGAAYKSSGRNGSECTVFLFKEGAHQPNEFAEVSIHHNLIEDMPAGIPMVKVDQQLARVRVWQNHVKNWRNILGGEVNTDATHAGVIRFTERAKQIEVYSNLFENIDMATGFLLVNFHNLKCTATTGLVSFPDADFGKFIIANNTRQNDGSADYPALVGDQPEFRFNGALPTNALTRIKAGNNRRLDPAGGLVGVSQIMRDSTTSTTYPGSGIEVEEPFLALAA